MLKHIVIFRLLNVKKEEENIVIEDLVSRLNNLKISIPEIKFLEVGVNISNRENAFDICLNTEFENEKNLEIYQKHPKHIELLDYLATLDLQVNLIDYIV
jgi:hypothetical protein